MKAKGFRRIVPLFWWVILIAVFSLVVMLLWNALMPAIFGLVVLNYWQAIGLLVLVRLLFGGIGGRHGMMRGGMGDGMHGENPIHAKWMKMSPEEREEFIRRRKSHTMGGGSFGRPNFFGGRDFNPKAEEANQQKNND